MRRMIFQLVLPVLGLACASCEVLPDTCEWNGCSQLYDGATAPVDARDGSRDAPKDGNDVGDDIIGDAGAERGDTQLDGGTDVVPCDATKKPSEASCVIEDRFGVFVSPSGSDGASGARAAPFKTISYALAHASGKNVYVCAGTYTEPITLGAAVDGAGMFGGFDCGSWAYSTSSRPKVAPASGIALTIQNLSMGATIEDFEFDAPDGTMPGNSSIAAVISSSMNVAFRRVKVVAGKGKEGSPGANGGGTGNMPAMKGADGNKGAAACTANPNLGGTTAITMCDGQAVSTGGKGGDGAISTAAQGDNGNDGTPPLTAGLGKGGQGEPLSGAWTCGANGTGQGGDDGMLGGTGDGATGLGSLTSNGWTGNRGDDGHDGKPGQGGGGGGGTKAPASCALPIPTGASAGSGGGGGCGGKAGGGGGPGGSSIAVVSVGSIVTFDACDLITNAGGKGGDGGQGQRGGDGGLPGGGGTGIGTSKNACSGGQGGQGGSGGPGGAGLGGHSIGVAYTGTAPTRLWGTVMTGIAGLGGAAGPGGTATGKGDDGITSPERKF